MRLWVVLVLAVAVAGCTTQRRTEPQRSATEEMLISSAADRAVGELRFDVKGKKVFVDATNYKGLDREYTVAAVHERLLRDGAMLVGDRKNADAVVEMRNGAQSIDQRNFLIGIPSFDLPIPLAGAFKFPEIALYRRAVDIGVSKLTVAGFDAKTGAYLGSSEPVYGFAHDKNYRVMIFFGWNRQDFRPNQEPTSAGAP